MSVQRSSKRMPLEKVETVSVFSLKTTLGQEFAEKPVAKPVDALHGATQKPITVGDFVLDDIESLAAMVKALRPKKLKITARPSPLRQATSISPSKCQKARQLPSFPPASKTHKPSPLCVELTFSSSDNESDDSVEELLSWDMETTTDGRHRALPALKPDHDASFKHHVAGDQITKSMGKTAKRQA